MPVAQLSSFPWSRKHDKPGVTVNGNATILYPQSLADLIEVSIKAQPPDKRLLAAGSHWALSRAAVSDWFFVETNDPRERFPALGRTLTEVVPKCLTVGALEDLALVSAADPQRAPYYVHIEAGKRIYQLYAELDRGDDLNPDSLARWMQSRFNTQNFLGPWAFETLGGAGGQTVFGALTTGTHGGDIRLPPVADSVRAIHLVADGGRHYWIEPERPSWIGRPGYIAGFTSTPKLTELYGGTDENRKFKSPDPVHFPDAGKFSVIRNDNTFNAVLMSPGRFGIVYSVVLQAVKQYGLRERRSLTDWQTIKNGVLDPNSLLYNARPDLNEGAPKFLQIAINIAPHSDPHGNGTRNRCAITKRFEAPLAVPPPGRAERVGIVVEELNTRLNAPRFDKAGASAVYDPKGSSGFLDRACANADFYEGVLDELNKELKQLTDNHLVVAGGIIAAAVGVAAAATVPGLIQAIAALLALLARYFESLRDRRNLRAGQVLDEVRTILLGGPPLPIPHWREAGVCLWRMFILKGFEQQQDNREYTAISYAVMDTHDYAEKSCLQNVDSIEVFFDATDPRLIAFVDAILRFESNQEFNGKAAVGYLSLRFMTKTRALIGPQRHALTCAVEVAALEDVAGSEEFVTFAETLSRDPNINGILHWGQRNDSSMAEIERRFGDTPANPTGDLRRWRAVLSQLTENGRLDGFSSQFTRQVGLEIVTPKIGTFTAGVVGAGLVRTITAHWDCGRNPPATKVRLDVVSPTGLLSTRQALDRTGSLNLTAVERGNYKLTLVATIVLNGESRDDSRLLVLNVV